MILETHHVNAAGVVRVVDLMPVDTSNSAIVRQVTGERGAVEMEFELRLRFSYGRTIPWRCADQRTATAIAGPEVVRVHAGADLLVEEDRITSRFVVRAGETVVFALQHGISYEREPSPLDIQACIAETEHYWRSWLHRFTKPTEWPDAVKRSLLVLQALIYQPSGGLIAAPTLGLPEIPGGRANWDYRYSWLRDSAFALSAFLNAGFKEEAAAWRDWLLRTVAGDPAHMRPVYRCDGGRYIGHHEASWLPGYDGAQPVNIGNAAAGQRQLDIFGEVLDSIHLATRAGIDDSRPWSIRVEEAILDHVEKIWQEPDQGIWEARGPPRQRTHSKVMAWVAADRFARLAAHWPHSDASRRNRSLRLRDTIHAAICCDGFNVSRNSFVSEFGGNEVDGSLLLLPLVGFLPSSDPRIRGTVAAVENELSEDGLIRRRPKSTHQIEEGAFIACTFWLADCLALQGRAAEARAHFERALALRNDVGLLSEEWDGCNQRLSGNFPQALSHLSLVNTALHLGSSSLQRGAPA